MVSSLILLRPLRVNILKQLFTSGSLLSRTSHIRIFLMRMLEYSRRPYKNFMKRVSRHVTPNLQRDWEIACFRSWKSCGLVSARKVLYLR